jgi:hypothetical protein
MIGICWFDVWISLNINIWFFLEFEIFEVDLENWIQSALPVPHGFQALTLSWQSLHPAGCSANNWPRGIGRSWKMMGLWWDYGLLWIASPKIANCPQFQVTDLEAHHLGTVKVAVRGNGRATAGNGSCSSVAVALAMINRAKWAVEHLVTTKSIHSKKHQNTIKLSRHVKNTTSEVQTFRKRTGKIPAPFSTRDDHSPRLRPAGPPCQPEISGPEMDPETEATICWFSH